VRATSHRVPRLCCLLSLLGLVPQVKAQTDEIQVYDAQIVELGHWNLTWHNNFTPSGRLQPDFPGGVVPDHALNGVPEWAYGVTDWFEAGVYLPLYTLTNTGQLQFDGAKLRTLFVSSHAAERTVFYGVNFEYSYNRPQWESHRFAGEIRPIIGTHLGPLDLIVNPIVDTQYNGLRNLEFVPAERVAYNFPRFSLALEHYADFGRLRHFAPLAQQSQTLFAVIDIGNSSWGLEFGVGHGFTAASDDLIIKLLLMRDL
jgi:hypothetical protein